MDTTYNDKILETFEKIISLPNERSDNFGRIKRIKKFAENLFSNKKSIYLLDIGSGLGVFPYSVKSIGWNCTAVDPDKRSISHIKKRIGIFIKTHGRAVRSKKSGAPPSHGCPPRHNASQILTFLPKKHLTDLRSTKSSRNFSRRLALFGRRFF